MDRKWMENKWMDENAMLRSLNFILKVTYNYEKILSIMIWADLHLRKITLTNPWNVKWSWIVVENKSPSEAKKKSQPEIRQGQWEREGGNKSETTDKIKRGDMWKVDEKTGLFSCFCLEVILTWPWNYRKRVRKNI